MRERKEERALSVWQKGRESVLRGVAVLRESGDEEHVACGDRLNVFTSKNNN